MTINCDKHGNYEAEKMTICGRTFFTCCPACEAERNAEEERSHKAEKMKQLQERGIEPEFFEATLENYKAETESEHQAKEAAVKLLRGEINKLLLLGSNGVGKTHIAVAVAKETGGIVTTMFAISARIRQGYNNGQSELDVLDRLLKYPFIAIDEVGRTKGSESERNWLSFLIDKAHTRGIKIMFISNRQLARSLPQDRRAEAFEAFMDNDVISRIKQKSEIVEVKGRDRRGPAPASV